MRTLLLYALTALAEIVGCWLPWLWLKQGRPAWLLTLHPGASGRVYAAYGGVYIGAALVWLWAVDGIRPTPWDLAGAAVVLAGMAIIVWQPRG